MSFYEEDRLVLLFALLLASFLGLLVLRAKDIPPSDCVAYNLKVRNSLQTPISEVQYQDCSGAVQSLRLNPGQTACLTVRASNDIVRTGVLSLLSETAGSVIITSVEFLGERRNVSFSEPDCGQVLIGDDGIELVFTGAGPANLCTFRLTSVR